MQGDSLLHQAQDALPPMPQLPAGITLPAGLPLINLPDQQVCAVFSQTVCCCYLQFSSILAMFCCLCSALALQGILNTSCKLSSSLAMQIYMLWCER